MATKRKTKRAGVATGSILELLAEAEDVQRGRLLDAAQRVDDLFAMTLSIKRMGNPAAVEMHRRACLAAETERDTSARTLMAMSGTRAELEEARSKVPDPTNATDERTKKTRHFLPEMYSAWAKGVSCGRVIWTHQRLADKNEPHLSEKTIRRKYQEWKAEGRPPEPPADKVADKCDRAPRYAEGNVSTTMARTAAKVTREASPEVAEAIKRGEEHVEATRKRVEAAQLKAARKMSKADALHFAASGGGEIEPGVLPPSRRYPVKLLPANVEVAITLLVPRLAVPKTRRELEALGFKRRGPLKMRLPGGQDEIP